MSADPIFQSGNGEREAPASDRFADTIALCNLAANAKAIKAQLRELAKINRQIADAEARLAALTAKAEQTQAALVTRVAELDARETALDAREDGFAASLKEARDDLRAYYDNLAETDRHIRYRILTSADLLAGFNEQLQDLPDWPQIRQMIPNLPDDPPPIEREVASHLRIDSFSDTFDDPNADRHGNAFLGTLSRDVSHKRGTA